jgi:hypothetical protein
MTTSHETDTRCAPHGAGGSPQTTPVTADEPPVVAAARAGSAQLRRAAATRAVIDQARGIVMERGRCSPQEAWEVLAEVSQHTNTKLHRIAEDLVASVGGDVPLTSSVAEAVGTALRRRRSRDHG